MTFELGLRSTREGVKGVLAMLVQLQCVHTQYYARALQHDILCILYNLNNTF